MYRYSDLYIAIVSDAESFAKEKAVFGKSKERWIRKRKEESTWLRYGIRGIKW